MIAPRGTDLLRDSNARFNEPWYGAASTPPASRIRAGRVFEYRTTLATGSGVSTVCVWGTRPQQSNDSDGCGFGRAILRFWTSDDPKQCIFPFTLLYSASHVTGFLTVSARINFCRWQVQQYVSVGILRYYFSVDTSYVLRKLGVLLWPFGHKVMLIDDLQLPFLGRTCC